MNDRIDVFYIFKVDVVLSIYINLVIIVKIIKGKNKVKMNFFVDYIKDFRVIERKETYSSYFNIDVNIISYRGYYRIGRKKEEKKEII